MLPLAQAELLGCTVRRERWQEGSLDVFSISNRVNECDQRKLEALQARHTNEMMRKFHCLAVWSVSGCGARHCFSLKLATLST